MITTKDELIQHLIRAGCLRTPHIIRVFGVIDRKDFVLPEYITEAYEDHPLPIGFGQTISQPLTVAFMLEQLNPQPGDHVLEIGAGSGWQSALLAEMVEGIGERSGRRGEVIAIEHIPELAAMAEQNIHQYGFIERKVLTILRGDGSKGDPSRAPFDCVIAAAAAKRVLPVAWKQQLIVGGRLVAPVKDTIRVIDRLSASDFNICDYKGFSFVPLVSSDDGGNGK